MAILFMDGFDHYSTLSDKGWSQVGGSGGSMNTSIFRTGTQSLRVGPLNSTTTAGMGRTVTAAASFRIAFGYYNTQSPLGFGIFVLRDSGTDQLTLRVNNDGTFSFCRGSGTGTVLGTGTAVMNTSTWVHLEAEVTINGTTGVAKLYVNNVLDINITNVNTQATGNSQANSIVLGSTVTTAALGAPNGAFHYDDFILADSAQSRIGVAVVQTIYPNAAGTTTQWTPSSAVANYTTVDEATSNADTDYVITGTSGNIDTYNFGDISTLSSTIIATAINLTARDDAGGANVINAVVRSGGTNYNQTNITLASTYYHYQTIVATNPATSTAWTPTTVNAAEFGMRKV